MKIKLFILVLAATICHTFPSKAQSDPKLLSWTGTEACCPYFTKDQNGLPFVCWTAKEADNTYIYYSGFNSQSGEFGQGKKINSSQGASMHPESMPKLAFKSDGTMIAVFEVKNPSESNPYAGSIHYVVSADQGKSWSDPKSLHKDTTPGKGRSFFDIARLHNGEIGACWLDASLPSGGRPLHFAITDAGHTFSNEKMIKSKVCECCRTAMHVGPSGEISIVFRDILDKEGDQQIRDMSLLMSNDNGITFEEKGRISEDDWEIKGCPHSGPGISSDENEHHYTWFSLGKGEGIFYTSKTAGNKYSQRTLITEDGLHPQIASQNHKTVVLFDNQSNVLNGKNTCLGIRVKENNSWSDIIPYCPMSGSASFPVITFLDKNQLIIAFSHHDDSNKNVSYQVLHFDELN